MTISDITGEISTRLGVPTRCVVEFAKALERIFADGERGLETNSNASVSVKRMLQECRACVSSVPCEENVVSGDDWELTHNPVAQNKSVDIIALCEDGSDYFLLPIEGKLGLACERSGDKAGASVSLKELEEKYLGSAELLCDGQQLIGKLIVVVPMNGQQWMWYRIRGWNHAGNKIGKIFSCCTFDLLALLGCGVVSRREHCRHDTYRTQLLQSEFEKIGPMSSVQLPPHDACLGCGRCRDVCREKVKRFAIAMVPDEGMCGKPMRPFVDVKSCKSGCRECERLCPVLHPEKSKRTSMS